MAEYKDILDFEIKRFKQDEKIEKYDPSNVKRALMLALRDAVSMAARRKGMAKYADKKDKIIEIILKKLEVEEGASLDFVFEDLVAKFIETMKSEEIKLNVYATCGFAQKFASMACKYFYCFDDVDKTKFSNCYMPLDSYTLNWYMNQKSADKSIVERIKVWSQLDGKLYKEIQEDILKIISDEEFEYEYYLGNKFIKCKPKNRLELEFIIWHQEMANNE